MSNKESKQESTDIRRREFLRGSVLTGAGATLVAAVPTLVQAQPEPVIPEASKPAEHKGYRLTSHISAYYRNAAN